MGYQIGSMWYPLSYFQFTTHQNHAFKIDRLSSANHTWGFWVDVTEMASQTSPNDSRGAATGLESYTPGATTGGFDSSLQYLRSTFQWVPWAGEDSYLVDDSTSGQYPMNGSWSSASSWFASKG
jgi:hypothetical protein